MTNSPSINSIHNPVMLMESLENLKIKKLLKKLSISLSILKWNGKKPKSNIQSIARVKRYDLLKRQCKTQKINYGKLYFVVVEENILL